MKHYLTLFLLSLLPSGFTLSQTATDLNEGTSLTYDSVNDSFKFSWWGRSDRTYFIQQSEDLVDWRYMPVIESGQNQSIEWGFATNADKLFMRLIHTDRVTADPINEDFDGDGISNIDEVTISRELPLDPFKPDSNENGVLDNLEDTDGDYIPDGEEFGSDLNVLDEDSMSDSDGDGLSNLREYRLGLSLTNPDTDGDGLEDGYELLIGTDPLDPNSNTVPPPGNPSIEPHGDVDGDHLANQMEVMTGTAKNTFDGVASIQSISDSGLPTSAFITVIGRGTFKLVEQDELLNLK